VPQTVAREARDMRERRYPKFEVRGSTFRKPRTSNLEPCQSRSAILWERSPVVQDMRTIKLLFYLVLFFRSLLSGW
jgi:hypothetical protein